MRRPGFQFGGGLHQRTIGIANKTVTGKTVLEGKKHCAKTKEDGLMPTNPCPQSKKDWPRQPWRAKTIRNMQRKGFPWSCRRTSGALGPWSFGPPVLLIPWSFTLFILVFYPLHPNHKKTRKQFWIGHGLIFNKIIPAKDPKQCRGVDK